MKKSLFSFILPLVVLTLAVVLVGPINVKAQTPVTPVCPVGYTCTILPTCPPGYTCTPTTIQPVGCPDGYTCTPTTSTCIPGYIPGPDGTCLPTSPELTMKVLSPNGGETLSLGKTWTIKWFGGKDKIDVWLLDNPTRLGKKIFSSIANTGSVDWTVTTLSSSDLQDKIGQYHDPSGQYVIFVNCADNNCTVDDSDASFSIASSSSQITITSPNGEEKWILGNKYQVKFDQSNFGGIQAKIHLIPQSFNGTACLLKYINLTEGLSSTDVDLSQGCLNAYEFGKIIPGNYKIQIYAGNSLGEDTSDSYFSISQPSTPCYAFSTNLQLGSRGPDVVALQTFLIGKGFNISDLNLTGANQKGYFGRSTYEALKKYQTSKGLPSTGYFGPLTRAVVNAECVQNTGRLVISTATDKPDYYDDEVIKITVKAFNSSNAPITLNFNTLCQSAYSVANFDSMVNLKCSQTLSSVTIKPQSPYYWEMRHDPSNYKIPAGQYKLQGRLLTVPERLADPALITVKSRTNQSSIAVLNPTAGEVLQTGFQYKIVWTTNSITDSTLFDITEFLDSGKDNIAEGLTPKTANCVQIVYIVPGENKYTCSTDWIPTLVSSKAQLAVSKRGTSEIGYSGSFSIASTTNTQPYITSVAGKAAGNGEIDAGGTVGIQGTNLAGYKDSTNVYIGGKVCTITQLGSTLIYCTAPSDLQVGSTYDLYINTVGVGGDKVTSNIVKVKVLSNVSQPTTIIPPQIYSFSAYPTTVNSGQPVELAWTTLPATVSSCILSGDGPTKSVKISTKYYETQPLTATTTFTLTCIGVNGQIISKSATVIVRSAAQTPTSLSGTIWDAVNEYLKLNPSSR
ncbi:MAG: peptidoglycan-binding protein [Patescibacteria group bacterium]